ncbi:MAG: hypothetical protein QM504_10875 [Pseudomonadota bacterium]
MEGWLFLYSIMDEKEKAARKEHLKQVLIQAKKVQTIISKFKENFPPAKDEGSSDHLLSTNAIASILIKHDNTLSFEYISLVQMLEKNEYKYEAVEEEGEIAFKWFVGTNNDN